MQKFLNEPIDILGWHTIFGLLSMERVEPFVVEMGVTLSRPAIESIRSVARQFTEEFWQRLERYPGYSKRALIEDEALMQRAFARIALATDEAAAQRLYDWGQHEFPWEGPDYAQAHEWESLLWRLHDLEDFGSIPPLPEDQVKAVIQNVREHLGDYRLLHDWVDEIDRKPRTEWEEKIYADHDPDSSPMVSVIAAVHVHRVRETLKVIRVHLRN